MDARRFAPRRRGRLQKSSDGWRFESIEVRPKLTVAHGMDADRATRLLVKTEGACVVSRSLASRVTMEPMVQNAGMGELA